MALSFYYGNDVDKHKKMKEMEYIGSETAKSLGRVIKVRNNVNVAYGVGK
jgi:hypothetical protein